MSAPCSSACSSWISDTATILDCCGDTEADADTLDAAAAVATDLLFELSGRRFPGTCLDVIQLCLGCNCASGCGCAPSERIMLPSAPVVSLLEVRNADATVADLAEFRIEDHRYLVRLDGQSWPHGADLTNPLAFQVSYGYGVAPPPAGVRAARALACELVKACLGADCALPSSVRSVTREGISFDLIDASDLLTDGVTGLPDVDRFLAAYNPARLQERGSVWSPDLPSYRRVT